MAKKKAASDKPWWHNEQMHFTCSECGDCCTGDPGYVWMNKAEIAAMAEEVGLSVAEFERQHVVQVGVRKSLRERENGDCVMFDAQTRKCTVYGARPRQCRTWPFWDSNLKSPDTWAQTCKDCPGSGQGRVYSIDEIEERMRQIKV